MLQQRVLPGAPPMMPIASIGLPVPHSLPGPPLLPFSPPPTAAVSSQCPPPLPPPPLSLIARLEALEAQSPAGQQRGLHQSHFSDGSAGHLSTPRVQVDLRSRQTSPLCTPNTINFSDAAEEMSPKQREVTVALKDLEQAQHILQSSGTYQSPAGAALATRIGRGKAELQDFRGALASFYEALRIRELTSTADTTAGALLFFELGRVRQQLGDTRAALSDYERCRDIRMKTDSLDTGEGRELMIIIKELKALIDHDAAKILAKWARGRLCRKRAACIKEATATPKPLPLPPLERAELLARHIAQDMIPVLMTGSNTHEFFTKRQRCLFKEVFRAIKGSAVLHSHAVMIGASAHGRAPQGRFSTWPLRGFVFDNIVQEEAFRSMGKDHTLMLTFEERAGDWVVEGPSCRSLKLGPKDGSIHCNADIQEEAWGQVVKIRTPDVSALPNVEPQQWQGVKSLPEIALVFGGGPRASQLASEREDDASCTMQMIDGKALLTRQNYPYKPGALFVLAAGGQPSVQIMASGPEQFKPPSVPEEVWERICNKEVVDFFADNCEADLGPDDDQMVVDYAASVLQALECLVQQAAAKKQRRQPRTFGLKDEDHRAISLHSELHKLRAELADLQAEREQYPVEGSQWNGSSGSQQHVGVGLALAGQREQALPETISSSRLERSPAPISEVPIASAEVPSAPPAVDGAEKLRKLLAEAERRSTELTLEHAQLRERSQRQEAEITELRYTVAEERSAAAALQTELTACRASTEAGRICRQELEITELRESLAEEKQAVASLQSELSACRASRASDQEPMPTTELTEPVLAGSKVLPVAASGGFTVGDPIYIESSAGSETNAVKGFGSIALMYPLKFSHPPGTSIGKLKPDDPRVKTLPEDFLAQVKEAAAAPESELVELRRRLAEEQDTVAALRDELAARGPLLSGGAGRASMEKELPMPTNRWSDILVDSVSETSGPATASRNRSQPLPEVALEEMDAMFHDLSTVKHSTVTLPQSLERPSDDILSEAPIGSKKVHFGDSSNEMFFVDLVSEAGSPKRPADVSVPSLFPQGPSQQRRTQLPGEKPPGAAPSGESSDSDASTTSEYWNGGLDSTRGSAAINRVQQLWAPSM